MGRRCRKSICLPELQEGDLLPVDGKPHVFALNLKSEPGLLINGELDLCNLQRHLSSVSARVLSDAINQAQVRNARFDSVGANSDWQNPQLSKIMEKCVSEALSESVVLSLKRMKNASSKLAKDFTCLLFLHMEENGLLRAPKEARGQIVKTYLRELACESRMEMDLSRLVKKRKFTRVWRGIVFPVFEQARQDFRNLRKELDRSRGLRRYKDFRAAWNLTKAQYAQYGPLLDRVETSAATELALEYVQVFFKCDTEPDAIYEQMKIARREREGQCASSPEHIIRDALDRLL